MYDEKVTARFWAKVTVVHDADSCWLWTAGLDKDGYGQASAAGKTMRAHRMSYIIAHGSIPAGAVLMHSCDNPGCVRPSHLTPGTAANNNADKAAKGRSTIGTTNPAAKLRLNEVRAIRELAAGGISGRRLSLIFGIHHTTATKLIRGDKWAKVA